MAMIRFSISSRAVFRSSNSTLALLVVALMFSSKTPSKLLRAFSFSQMQAGQWIPEISTSSSQIKGLFSSRRKSFENIELALCLSKCFELGFARFCSPFLSFE